MKPEREIVDELKEGIAEAFVNQNKANGQTLYSFAFTYSEFREFILEKAISNLKHEEAVKFGDILEHVNPIVLELPPH